VANPPQATLWFGVENCLRNIALSALKAPFKSLDFRTFVPSQ
jgi:hypothetical protein